MFDHAPFLAWDGEGVTTATRLESKPATTGSIEIHDHAYVLLANSLDSHIQNLSGLSTLDCLQFLTDTAATYPGRLHVCFGMSYDANMMLGMLARPLVWALYHGNPVTVDRYTLQYRHRKSLSIKRRSKQKWTRHPKTGDWQPDFDVSMTLWDVFGFFQAPFVVAVERWLGRTYAGLKAIKEGKARRSQFRAEEVESFVLPYTRLENQALSLMMERLRESLRATNLVIARWDGAGAVAAAEFRRENVKGHLSRHDGRDDVPEEVHRAAQYAYAGGRIELLQYGHHPHPVDHGDINSAYPWAMLELPSLRGGDWQLVEGPRLDSLPPFSVCHVVWDFADDRPFYPFFYREWHDAIIFPRQGEGWYWLPEVIAAAQVDREGFELVEAWMFLPETEVKPFAFLQATYQKRLKLKRAGNPAEKVLKLGALNSGYGKLVQQVGARHGRLPPFHQLEWGGYITARVRAALYLAGMQMPERVIKFSTDGLWTLSKLDLDYGEGLGQWDYKRHQGLTVAQSGIYWTDELPVEECKEPSCLRLRPDHVHEFRRGFDKDSVTREAVIGGWRAGLEILECRATRFIGMGSALQGETSFEDWRHWRTAPRELHLNAEGTKRLDINHGAPWHPDRGLVETEPRLNTAKGMISKPYILAWERAEPSDWEWQKVIEEEMIDGEV